MEVEYLCYSKADYHSELPEELRSKKVDTYCMEKNKKVEGIS